ncbi:MAG: STAS-like domain-containing protein [Firmicutes bacterium]|jgi:hypothetical protein|nr:STAS-like domain-containing protein [Bacillota bacterium]
MNIIKIFDISPICMSENDGTILRSKMIMCLEKNEDILLNFERVKLFASPFFNSSIGYIISKYGMDVFSKKIKIEKLNSVGRSVLDLVIKNAVEFSSLDKNGQEIISEILQKLEE